MMEAMLYDQIREVAEKNEQCDVTIRQDEDGGVWAKVSPCSSDIGVEFLPQTVYDNGVRVSVAGAETYFDVQIEVEQGNEDLILNIV